MIASLSRKTLFRPRSVAEAFRMLRDEAPLTPLAGCTDLYVSMNFGTLDRARFIDLWPLDDLRGISRRAHAIRIGALTTYTQIIRSPIVGRDLPMLAAAAHEIGAVQIQNRGTIGGNVANASPAGDTLPVLAATDAVVEIGSARGVRRVPFTSFYTGYRQMDLGPGELILALEIPRTPGRRQWFRKVGTRRAQAISKVVIAACGGAAPAIALGSVAPTVVRLPETERALAAGASIEEAQRLMLAEIAPIDDVRSTADYRRRVAGNLLAECLRGLRTAR